jgi:ataxia telangiectasia mutated family protein
VRHIISSRETILSCLSRQPHLRQMMKISASDSRLVEVRTSLLSSDINRAHGALQESLTSATYLTGLVEPCRGLGLSIESAVYLEAANALWDQGEMSSSIGMLSDLNGLHNSKQQSIPISRSHLLAKIASQVSVARLEKPDRIMSKYLSPALKELKGKSEGTDAGQVYREFALFCDRQYQDPDSLEDLERLRKLKENKEKEVRELSQLVKAASSGTERAKVANQFSKAKMWLHLDSEEYRRLDENRDDLLQQSLENYLLSLAAWDEHNNDALRFTALWMEHSDLDLANQSVSKWLSKVPSLKFASLTNQLTSRLLDDSTEFQKLLFSLVLNVCTDHPYHGMYQIWAASKSAVGKTDDTALSRQKATQKMGRELSGVKKSGIVWQSINYVNHQYCQFAAETGDRYKAGHKIRLRDSAAGQKLNNAISKVELPPPTLQVEVAADLDYSKLPSMHNLEPQIAIASGVSAPKIITIVGSNGAKYRQLVSLPVFLNKEILIMLGQRWLGRSTPGRNYGAGICTSRRTPQSEYCNQTARCWH